MPQQEQNVDNEMWSCVWCLSEYKAKESDANDRTLYCCRLHELKDAE